MFENLTEELNACFTSPDGSGKEKSPKASKEEALAENQDSPDTASKNDDTLISVFATKTQNDDYGITCTNVKSLLGHCSVNNNNANVQQRQRQRQQQQQQQLEFFFPIRVFSTTTDGTT